MENISLRKKQHTHTHTHTHTHMQTSLKTGFAQISLAAQKIQVAQIWEGGAAGPPAPPAHTPMP